MTKDEILEYFKDINHAYNDCTRYDTLKRMLDELQEPCEDAISRQAVLNMLEDINAETEGVGFYYKHYVEYIKKLPPVTPQYTEAEIQKMQDLEFAEIQKAYEIGKAENPNKWIPVSERLPKTKFGEARDVNEYLVTVVERWESSDKWEYHIDVATNWGTYIDGFWDTYNDWYEGQEVHVIAWMPLPEPYKASPTGAERSEKE